MLNRPPQRSEYDCIQVCGLWMPAQWEKEMPGVHKQHAHQGKEICMRKMLEHMEEVKVWAV